LYVPSSSYVFLEWLSSNREARGDVDGDYHGDYYWTDGESRPEVKEEEKPVDIRNGNGFRGSECTTK
jgi:hypothetical protein